MVTRRRGHPRDDRALEGIGVQLLAVSDPSQAAGIRRAAAALGNELGFNETESGKLAIVVTEVATNLLKHGHGGHVLLRSLNHYGVPAIEVVGIDSGPGMTDPGECLRDGYSTAGSAGTGLGAIQRLSWESEIHSQPGRGTVVRAVCGRSARPAATTTGSPPLELGIVQAAYPGEDVCGDAVAASETPAGVRVLMADGLGHGLLAYEAAQRAIRTFHDHSSLDIVTQMSRLHDALRSTRGAASAIADIDESAAVVRFCGVGNIAAVVIGATRSNHLVSMPGITGHQARSLRSFEQEWSSSSILVLHSDGLTSKWDLKEYPGLAARSASVVAATLFRDARRTNDDASIAVVKRRV